MLRKFETSLHFNTANNLNYSSAHLHCSNLKMKSIILKIWLLIKLKFNFTTPTPNARKYPFIKDGKKFRDP